LQVSLSSDLSFSFGAQGKLEQIKLMNEVGANMNCADYDNRTIAHLAASESQLKVVEYLMFNADFDFSIKDRWGNTPIDDLKDLN